MLQLLGLTGPARSGKDTVADYLVRHHGYHRIAFADPLKQMVAGFLNISLDRLEQVKDSWVTPFGCTPRRLLQTLGTEWGRDLIGINTWTIAAAQRVAPLLAAGERVVISDVRFASETAHVRAQGGILWHLVRPDAPSVDDHASELGVPMGEEDAVLLNVGTLAELYDQIEDQLAHPGDWWAPPGLALRGLI